MNYLVTIKTLRKIEIQYIMSSDDTVNSIRSRLANDPVMLATHSEGLTKNNYMITHKGIAVGSQTLGELSPREQSIEFKVNLAV